MALFGETYGEEVRVLAMGVDEGAGPDERKPYSVELCGGTHVRRIEALIGEAARDQLNAQEARLLESAAALKSAPAEVPARIAALVDQRRRLERDLAEARRKLATGGGAAPEVREVGGIKLAARRLEGATPKELRGLADDLKKRIGSGVVALVAVTDGKAALVVGVTDDLTGRCNAVELARIGAEALGGKGGGGRPDMAQAGGPDGAKADAALAAIAEALAA